MLSAIVYFIVLAGIQACTSGPWERSFYFLPVVLPAIPLYLGATMAAPNLTNILIEALPRGGGMVLFLIVGVLGWGVAGFVFGVLLQWKAKHH